MLGIAAAVVTVVVVLPVAFLTMRYRSAAGETANAIIVAGFALPGLVLALSIVFFVVQSDVLSDLVYQTYLLLVFAYVVHFGSQALRSQPGRRRPACRAASRTPRSRSVRAARVAWRRCNCPLMRPGLLAGAGLVLLSTMKELPATLVLAPPDTETLATQIWSATRDGFFAKAGLAALVLVALSGVLTYFLTVRAVGARVKFWLHARARRRRCRVLGRAGHRRARVARRARDRRRAAVPANARSASAKTSTSTSATSAPRTATASSTRRSSPCRSSAGPTGAR